MDEGHCEIHRAGALCLPIYPINSWSKGIQCWLQGGEFPFIWAIVHIQPLHIYWLSVGWMKRQGTKTRHTYVLLQLTDHLLQEMKCMHQLLCNSEYSSFLTHGSLWWKLSLAPPCNDFLPWAPRTSFSGSSLSYPLLPCRHLCCFFLSSTHSKGGHAPGLSPQPSAHFTLLSSFRYHLTASFHCGNGDLQEHSQVHPSNPLPWTQTFNINWKLCAVYVSHSFFVWLFGTPWTVAHQAPLSMEFSR